MLATNTTVAAAVCIGGDSADVALAAAAAVRFSLGRRSIALRLTAATETHNDSGAAAAAAAVAHLKRRENLPSGSQSVISAAAAAASAISLTQAPPRRSAVLREGKALPHIPQKATGISSYVALLFPTSVHQSCRRRRCCCRTDAREQFANFSAANFTQSGLLSRKQNIAHSSSDQNNTNNPHCRPHFSRSTSRF